MTFTRNVLYHWGSEFLIELVCPMPASDLGAALAPCCELTEGARLTSLLSRRATVRSSGLPQ